MATDVDVQYFSHLNGLTLGNNWGDLIRLLDKALVTGIDFTQITAASIDAQGDVHITLYAAHNAMLFQVVELSGFAPASLNQKYRIKGVPSTTELILKPHTAITETSITTVGAGKLASLGYDIIFRDTNDVKRVYRAKNPTAQHPFIRVDESLTSPDGTTGVYTSTYAKYAMVGLLEHMDHIDDCENPEVLQLPFDPADPAKNWKITGSGTGVVRGWSRWYWSHSYNFASGSHIDSATPTASPNFALIGDKDAFYIAHGVNSANVKILYGCGFYDAGVKSSLVPNWFLMTSLKDVAAGALFSTINSIGYAPLMLDANRAAFFVPKVDELTPLSAHTTARPILPDYRGGETEVYAGNDVAALNVPFGANNHLLGTLKHVQYAYRQLSNYNTAEVLLSEASMYLATALLSATNAQKGGVYFYLGELE